MKTLGLMTLFMPSYWLLPLLTVAGFLVMFGQRKLAGSFLVLVLITAFSPMFEPICDALFTAMPWWFSLVLVGGLILMFAGRFLRDVFVQVVGDLIASGIKLILRSPMALLTILTAVGVLWVTAD